MLCAVKKPIVAYERRRERGREREGGGREDCDVLGTINSFSHTTIF